MEGWYLPLSLSHVGLLLSFFQTFPCSSDPRGHQVRQADHTGIGLDKVELSRDLETFIAVRRLRYLCRIH